MTAQTNLQKAQALLGGMSRDELIDLRDTINDLLEIEFSEDDQEQSTDAATLRQHTGRGHIELKMIGKNGPYKYLRYWEGKTLRSKYLGKAKDAEK